MAIVADVDGQIEWSNDRIHGPGELPKDGRTGPYLSLCGEDTMGLLLEGLDSAHLGGPRGLRRSGLASDNNIDAIRFGWVNCFTFVTIQHLRCDGRLASCC